MTPLPFDFYRCDPFPVPATKCHQCPRWAAHPQQTWGERTATMVQDPKTCGVPELEKTK